VSAARVTPSREIERQRRRRGHSCWDHLIAGASLNVAVAGSLVLYRLAGFL
jgi:hypothetical protein